jgi:beta-ribofuranosylaminobenzene 5'-phosphate synthase
MHVVRVTTGSRLHFGMFSFGHALGSATAGLLAPRQFGGVGLMVAEPGIRLNVRPAPQLEAVGPLAERALDFVRRTTAALQLPGLPQCRIQIESAPREHIGLGTGTQLGMAIATAIHILAGQPLGLPGELATTVGRGQRSAIGAHGFAVGGLLVEAGKRRSEDISPLVARLELPDAWRVLLVLPRATTGLHGEAERQAFARLPPVPRETTAALCSEALMHLLPAAVDADFEAFSASLYRFGQIAGSCFASQQEGNFFDRRTAQLARRLHELGVTGIGQSSWGPLLFAILPNEAAGQEIAAAVRDEADAADYDCILSACQNEGAAVEVG